MKKSIFTITLLALLCAANTVWAAESDTDLAPNASLGELLVHYLVDGASITVGVGGRAISVEVQRIGTKDRGKLIDTDEDAYFFSYNLKDSYLDTSNVGYSWMFNLSSFELHKQEVEPKVTEDLGTRVEGEFAYIVPTLFYNWGDKYNGKHFRAGIGLGLGVAKFHGDIILTESSTPNDRAAISNGPSNLFFAAGLFLEGQIDYFTIRVANGGPELEYDGYKIKIKDTNIMIGLTIPFD